MATLTAYVEDLNTVSFTLTNYMLQYAHEADVLIYEDETDQFIDIVSFLNISTERLEGRFVNLKEHTRYRLISRMFDGDGNLTSSLRTYITTSFFVPSGRHSIILYPLEFNQEEGIDVYEEWGLIPTERPVVNPPQVKSRFVELPGSRESIDYTSLLTGKIAYGQRTGSWTFYWDSDWPGSEKIANIRRKVRRTLWLKVYDDILNRVHGKKIYAALEDEPWIIYSGRIAIGKWDASGIFSRVTFTYNFKPETSETRPFASSETSTHFDPNP